ncbi:putative metal-binding integral membrane protein [Burkholderia sp. 8Y]|uniref:DUF2182 domain-containing protein n=1 Tax=Burkholderia sp. 8Y TaxID=2653133 RepID=UPI0012F3CB56|nr:DUF2182 domain-containing protein [Burkholderia sp. 8Y]VXB02721.1 putative metal-binding integral membrane protein [Burkholderia sp. 8Y]
MTSTPIERAVDGGIVIKDDERRGLVMLRVVAFALSGAIIVACHAWMPSMDSSRPCGQTALGAAAAFVAMWTVMMTAMMLPSFAQTLWRCRASGAAPLALMTAGYVTAWSIAGIALYPLGGRWSTLAMAKPVASGAVIVLAGIVQASRWKARRLAHCRSLIAHRVTMRDAYRHGLQHGMQCIASCAGLTVTLCVVGMMDASAIATVMLAIAAERLLPRGERIAQGIGALMIASGIAWMLHAVT